MNIIVCGDFAPVARGIDAVIEKSAFNKEIVEIFKKSDCTIINLESPVADDEDYSIQKNGPHLRTGPYSIEYLKDCGVDIVTLANNHFFDYGINGVSETISMCKKNGVQYVGGGCNLKERSRILYFEKDSIKVAILNYCENEFSVQIECGSNPINPITAYYDINEAKKNADKVIIITHGGHEGYKLPSPRMKQLYRYFIDLGADIVCNHHQHCYSGYENYKGGVIFYGLGNFFFDDHRAKRNQSDLWNYGYIVSLDIQKNKLEYEILPYEQCTSISSTQLLNDISKIQFFNNIDDLNAIINNDSELANSFENWCSKKKNIMLSWFSPYSNRFLLSLSRRGFLPSFISRKKKTLLLNMISCESHRDVILKILREK